MYAEEITYLKSEMYTDEVTSLKFGMCTEVVTSILFHTYIEVVTSLMSGVHAFVLTPVLPTENRSILHESIIQQSRSATIVHCRQYANLLRTAMGHGYTFCLNGSKPNQGNLQTVSLSLDHSASKPIVL